MKLNYTKSYTLFLAIITSYNLLAGDVYNPQENIKKEAANDQILYNNAANTKPKETTPAFVKPFAKGNANGEVEQNLTDEQKVLSENFVHQGKLNREMQAKCAGKEMEELCAGNDPNASRKAIIGAVAKAYSMFGALMDDKFLALKKPVEAPKTDAVKTDAVKTDAAKPEATAKEDPKKEENQTDYCKYIPMVSEGVSMFMQQSAGKVLNLPASGNESAQKDALIKASKNHEERAKGAQIQAYGWGATAACYTGMMVTGTVALNQASIWIKWGASTFLAVNYFKDADENKGFAEKIKNLANTLPGKGDCNPVTDRVCYCSQPETENDTTYCYPELHNKAIASRSARVTCTDSNLKSDPTCQCEKMNNCFEKLMINQDVNNALGFATGAGSPFNSVRQLSRGEANSGVMSGAAYNQMMAIAKKANGLLNKVPGLNQNLNASENKNASIYQQAGIPSSVAAHMAAMNVSKSALDAAMAKASGLSGLAVASIDPSIYKSRNIDFSGGNALNGRGKVEKKDDDFMNKFGALGKKVDAKAPNKLIEFAVQKSQQQNQVSKTDRSIFEIISNRYSGSAFRMLELEK